MRVSSSLCCLLLVVFSCFGQTGSPSPSHNGVVPHWSRTGNNVNDVYTISADGNVVHGGKSSVSIRCTTCSTARVPEDSPESANPFGSIIQIVRADKFRGKRIVFAAYLKTLDLQGDGAGLWVRVDGASGVPLALDNMSDPDRLVRGTTDWKQYRVVVDVAQDAQAIAFGALVMGRGQMWIDDASLDITTPSTPETADQKKMREGLQKQMRQLTPEQRAEIEKDAEQARERAKTYPTEIQNPGFEP